MVFEFITIYWFSQHFSVNNHLTQNNIEIVCSSFIAAQNQSTTNSICQFALYFFSQKKEIIHFDSCFAGHRFIYAFYFFFIFFDANAKCTKATAKSNECFIRTKPAKTLIRSPRSARQWIPLRWGNSVERRWLLVLFSRSLSISVSHSLNFQ